MKKRIVSLLLALVMVLSLVPMSVFAADNHDGQVHVIVENTTYPEAEGAPWEGTLVEEWIDLNEDSTMMGCVVEALEMNGYEQTGAENNYISSYDALTDAQKELVGNYQTLLDAEAKLADLQAADAVEKLIDAMGTVTLDSEEAIKAARDAYDALTDAQKELVGNYQTLLDAEAKLAQLKKDAEKPSQPEQPAKPGEDANKPATGDAGVALWLTVMCMTTLLGAALVSKKRKA